MEDIPEQLRTPKVPQVSPLLYFFIVLKIKESTEEIRGILFMIEIDYAYLLLWEIIKVKIVAKDPTMLEIDDIHYSCVLC